MNPTRAVIIRLALFGFISGGIMPERADATSVTNFYRFVQPSLTGAKVSGSFMFDNTSLSPVVMSEFTLTAFSISWLGGVNFGVFDTNDPRAKFSSLPTFSGGSLSGTLDVTMQTEFGASRFLGNFDPVKRSIYLFRLPGTQLRDYVDGAINYVTVPEPSTFICASFGLIGLCVWRQYRGRRA